MGLVNKALFALDDLHSVADVNLVGLFALMIICNHLLMYQSTPLGRRLSIVRHIPGILRRGAESIRRNPSSCLRRIDLIALG